MAKFNQINTDNTDNNDSPKFVYPSYISIYRLFGFLKESISRLSLTPEKHTRSRTPFTRQRRMGFLPCPLFPIDSVCLFLKDNRNKWLLKHCAMLIVTILIRSFIYICAYVAVIISMVSIYGALTGCVAIINYAPRAEKASLYSHDQNASNMIVNQEIPMTAQLADELSVKGVEVQKPTIRKAGTK